MHQSVTAHRVSRFRCPECNWEQLIATAGAPVRLIADDPIYEVLPAHVELLSARGFSFKVVPTRSSHRHRTAN